MSLSLATLLREAATVPKWKIRPELLLMPNIPKPMHGVAPRVTLGQAWWDAERERAFASTDSYCAACGTPKHKTSKGWLEGHEVYKIDYIRGTMTYLETVPLCTYCHSYIHGGRLKAMLDQGKITHGHYAAVIQHGEAVLRRANLVRSSGLSAAQLKRMAKWSKWRLIIPKSVAGKLMKVKPKYRNEQAWLEDHKR